MMMTVEGDDELENIIMNGFGLRLRDGRRYPH